MTFKDISVKVLELVLNEQIVMILSMRDFIGQADGVILGQTGGLCDPLL